VSNFLALGNGHKLGSEVRISRYKELMCNLSCSMNSASSVLFKSTRKNAYVIQSRVENDNIITDYSILGHLVALASSATTFT
jgi:hypothetical protein